MTAEDIIVHIFYVVDEAKRVPKRICTPFTISVSKTSVFEKHRTLPDFGPISPVFASQNCFLKPRFRKASAQMSFARRKYL